MLSSRQSTAIPGSCIRSVFPLPVQRPRPRVLLGGMGEKMTLRLVAQYADACNLFDIPDHDQTMRHKLEVLAHHCEKVGRPHGRSKKR